MAAARDVDVAPSSSCPARENHLNSALGRWFFVFMEILGLARK
jgi:hypothetical protein